MFNKVLIANRGEIACRIMRTCRRLGIKSVAIYSDADVESPHVKLADEAHHIGSSPAAESYLNMDSIISVAKMSGSDAVHPGYGFLSENPRFAEKVAEAGLIFIGPTPESMIAIGNKANARRLLSGSTVPLIPWAEITVGKSDEAQVVAQKLGLPLLVKPSNAGGGKGTFLVHAEGELSSAVESAAKVAMSSFGTASVHLERYLKNVRHIEIQVVADQYGNAIHLLERDCSWQRRYQKIIEESPSMAVSPLLRQRLAEAALTVMKTARYVNAGTVEFLVDGQNNFYFLETNCRIQVEHPVTELITGIDIVELQLKIASGQKLGISQSVIVGRGHAIEARIYAEDPDTLLPSGGIIAEYREPSGAGVRVDSGVCQDYEVTLYYDPILAKLIVWSETREEAIAKMRDALHEFVIGGLITNIPLLSKILSHPYFESGEYDVSSITPEFIKTKIPLKPGGQGVGIWEYWRWGR